MLWIMNGFGKTKRHGFAKPFLDLLKRNNSMNFPLRNLIGLMTMQVLWHTKKSIRNPLFGSGIKTGILSGNARDFNADFLFATVQTLSKQENLKAFSRDYFEACIYDEAHHTSADSYKKVMDYFEPSFTLGMTATPDKRDDNIEGRNIYEIFDHNIAYEIRGHTSGRVFSTRDAFFWLKL